MFTDKKCQTGEHATTVREHVRRWFGLYFLELLPSFSITLAAAIR